MARLIHPDRTDEPPFGIGCREWLVRGAVCGNAAAKFWSGLFDEVLSDYPFGPTLALCAAVDAPLTRADLHPDRALERDAAAWEGRDLRQMYRETLALLEITGAPTPTTIRLSRPGQPAPFLTMLLEQPDAETLPFLLAWLLEWQDIPSADWNGACVEGAFVADDLARSRGYEVRCRLECRPMSEGLCQREAILHVRLR
jgi:hypothetical protein